jgi:transposase-like protein
VPKSNGSKYWRRADGWSEDEKLKIVLESLQAPRQVGATAQRYGVPTYRNAVRLIERAHRLGLST